MLNLYARNANHEDRRKKKRHKIARPCNLFIDEAKLFLIFTFP